MTADQIREAIETALPGARVLVRDLTGTGDHYHAVVGAPQFEGKGLMEQHRLVYQALGATVGAEVHALALKTCVPEHFERTVEANPV